MSTVIFPNSLPGIKTKFVFITILLCLSSSLLTAQSRTDSLLIEINQAISNSPSYDKIKNDRIDSIKLTLKNSGSISQRARFNLYSLLYNEYQIYNYDSAFSYAQKMVSGARSIQEDSLVGYAKIKMGFVLLSSGLFKETFDLLDKMNLDQLSKPDRAEYYTLLARYYYDLADYDNEHIYTPRYNDSGNRYIDSSLTLFPPESFEHIYYSGLKNIRAANYDLALTFLEKLKEAYPMSPHEVAVTTSTLSDIYIQKGQTDTAINLLMRAAIEDIRNSTKETRAIFNLATLLFKRGDAKNASTFIEKAVNDAVFYGARQRKVQLTSILPLIEAEKMNILQNENKRIVNYAIVVTLSSLLLISLLIIIFRQIKKLELAKADITIAHRQQQLINTRLQEANKIKEEYIGYFFSGNSEFYSRIEKFIQSVEAKIADRKLDDIRFLVNNLNLKKGREEVLHDFDQIFLKLFPNFTTEFNSLISEDGKVKIKEGELLNTDLRIFALIRMGIHDTQKIAGILGYSVNTINTYKSKIKNKSVGPNEDFEEKIMQIKSI
jgi:tetratricopeptide (TPR) repeat protein